MTDRQIISWIFYAVAMASQEKPTDIKGISMIADGINHAIPTQKELNLAIAWLLKEKLIKEEGRKYSLTKKGHINYGFARLHTTKFSSVWKNLELQLKNIGLH